MQWWIFTGKNMNQKKHGAKRSCMFSFKAKKKLNSLYVLYASIFSLLQPYVPDLRDLTASQPGDSGGEVGVKNDTVVCRYETVWMSGMLDAFVSRERGLE